MIYEPEDEDKRALRLRGKGFVPAYQDSSLANLKSGFFCHFCGMAYYNCLCAHDDE